MRTLPGIVVTVLLPTVLLAGGCSSPTSSPPSASTPAPAATAGPRPDLPNPDTADGGLPLTTPKGADAEARLDAMEKLVYLIGRWEGEGTVTTPQGKTTFTQTEVIRRHLTGDLISVQGNGTAPNGQAVFSAFAIVTYSSQNQSYRWRAYSDQSPTGEPIETELHLTADGWYWDSPAGTEPTMFLRHEAKFTADTWQETSKLTRDGGQTWQPTLELNLKRVR